MHDLPRPEERRETPQATPSAAPTSYQPVDANVAEQRNGGVLMVEAYALVWLVLMGWLLFMWLRQRAVDDRIEGLEAAIARAEARRAGGA